MWKGAGEGFGRTWRCWQLGSHFLLQQQGLSRGHHGTKHGEKQIPWTTPTPRGAHVCLNHTLLWILKCRLFTMFGFNFSKVIQRCAPILRSSFWACSSEYDLARHSETLTLLFNCIDDHSILLVMVRAGRAAAAKRMLLTPEQTWGWETGTPPRGGLWGEGCSTDRASEVRVSGGALCFSTLLPAAALLLQP